MHFFIRIITNTGLLLGSLSISGTLVTASCNKCKNPGLYSCTGGVATVAPDLDSIRVGDTLSFRCAIPTNLKYYIGPGIDSGQIDMSSATNVRTDMHFTIIAGFNSNNPALDSFLVISQIGMITDNPYPNARNYAKSISFVQIDSTFQFSCKMVALKRGIYCIDIIDIFAAEKECNKASVAITFQNTNQHLHYLKDIYYGGGTMNPIDQRISYCFKVY